MKRTPCAASASSKNRLGPSSRATNSSGRTPASPNPPETASRATAAVVSAVVRAIATLGTGLGMTVIAEGVETRAQARMVEADGCTEIQGYLISKPIPPREIVALLARNPASVLSE